MYNHQLSIQCGRVAEWPNATVLKTVVPLRGPWVRILPLPIRLRTLAFFKDWQGARAHCEC